jgi:hypothetical protein
VSERIFCGNGKQVMDWKIGISVCLDDIPAQYIKTAGNGKRYVNLDVNAHRDGADRYGKTHSVEVNTWTPESKQKPGAPVSKRQSNAPEDFEDDYLDVPF